MIVSNPKGGAYILRICCLTYVYIYTPMCEGVCKRVYVSMVMFIYFFQNIRVNNPYACASTYMRASMYMYSDMNTYVNLYLKQVLPVHRFIKALPIYTHPLTSNCIATPRLKTERRHLPSSTSTSSTRAVLTMSSALFTYKVMSVRRVTLPRPRKKVRH